MCLECVVSNIKVRPTWRKVPCEQHICVTQSYNIRKSSIKGAMCIVHQKGIGLKFT